MSRLLLFIVAILFQELSFAQEINMVKSFGGVRFETDTLTLSSRQVLEILQDEPLAYKEFKLARLNNSMAGVLGFTGGLMIALPIVSAIAGSQPQWGFAAGGGLLILSSVPLIRAFTRHAQQALKAHNKSLSSTRIKTNFCFAGSGVGLVIRF